MSHVVPEQFVVTSAGASQITCDSTMRNAWDRGWLNAIRVRWKQARRRSRRDGTGHALGNSETWCKICDEKVPEDGRYVLCRCRHAAYKNLRKRWYTGLKDKFEKLFPRMAEAKAQRSARRSPLNFS